MVYVLVNLFYVKKIKKRRQKVHSTQVTCASKGTMWCRYNYGLQLKSHTRGCISFGIGVLLAMSAKQKLNYNLIIKCNDVYSNIGEGIGFYNWILHVVSLFVFLLISCEPSCVKMIPCDAIPI